MWRVHIDVRIVFELLTNAKKFVWQSSKLPPLVIVVGFIISATVFFPTSSFLFYFVFSRRFLRFAATLFSFLVLDFLFSSLFSLQYVFFSSGISHATRIVVVHTRTTRKWFTIQWLNRCIVDFVNLKCICVVKQNEWMDRRCDDDDDDDCDVDASIVFSCTRIAQKLHAHTPNFFNRRTKNRIEIRFDLSFFCSIF